MAIVMSAGETDDPGFIEVLNSILSELIAEHAPDQFWVIQMDNWFDHKWLGFSGMGLIASNIPLNTYDTVKAESYQEKVTFPPFTRQTGWSGSSHLCGLGIATQMAYVVTADQVECWSAAFNRQQEWKLQATKGVSRSRLERWLKNRTQ